MSQDPNSAGLTPPVAFSSRVRAADGVLVRQLAGEAVLVNLLSETYYGLDPMGTRSWELLTSLPSVEAAFEALLSEFDVTPDVLRADLRRFLDDLLSHGLLKPEP